MKKKVLSVLLAGAMVVGLTGVSLATWGRVTQDVDYADINVHVHLCDNNRRYPGNCGLDFEKIIQTFHDVGYDDLYSTEVFQFPSMEECAKRSIAYLAPIFQRVYGRETRV